MKLKLNRIAFIVVLLGVLWLSTSPVRAEDPLGSDISSELDIYGNIAVINNTAGEVIVNWGGSYFLVPAKGVVFVRSQGAAKESCEHAVQYSWPVEWDNLPLDGIKDVRKGWIRIGINCSGENLRDKYPHGEVAKIQPRPQPIDPYMDGLTVESPCENDCPPYEENVMYDPGLIEVLTGEGSPFKHESPSRLWTAGACAAERLDTTQYVAPVDLIHVMNECLAEIK